LEERRKIGMRATDAVRALVFRPVHAIRSGTADPLLKYMWRVSVPGLPEGIGFQKCSGLTEEIAVTEYQEGGVDYAHKLPSRVKVSEVVMERGEYIGDAGLKSSLQKVMTSDEYRTTVIIEKLTRFGTVARTYKLAEAWVSKWEGSDGDMTSDDVAIEKITIQFEHYL
jgi:phage tail-like protein